MTDLLTRLAALHDHHAAHRERALAANVASLVENAGFTVEQAVEFATDKPGRDLAAHDTALETIRLAVAALDRKPTPRKKAR